MVKAKCGCQEGGFSGPGPEAEEFGEQLTSLPTSYSLFNFLSILLNISRRMAQIVTLLAHLLIPFPESTLCAKHFTFLGI